MLYHWRYKLVYNCICLVERTVCFNNFRHHAFHSICILTLSGKWITESTSAGCFPTKFNCFDMCISCVMRTLPLARTHTVCESRDLGLSSGSQCVYRTRWEHCLSHEGIRVTGVRCPRAANVYIVRDENTAARTKAYESRDLCVLGRPNFARNSDKSL